MHACMNEVCHGKEREAKDSRNIILQQDTSRSQNRALQTETKRKEKKNTRCCEKNKTLDLTDLLTYCEFDLGPTVSCPLNIISFLAP